MYKVNISMPNGISINIEGVTMQEYNAIMKILLRSDGSHISGTVQSDERLDREGNDNSPLPFPTKPDAKEL